MRHRACLRSVASSGGGRNSCAAAGGWSCSSDSAPGVKHLSTRSDQSLAGLSLCLHCRSRTLPAFKTFHTPHAATETRPSLSPPRTLHRLPLDSLSSAPLEPLRARGNRWHVRIRLPQPPVGQSVVRRGITAGGLSPIAFSWRRQRHRCRRNPLCCGNWGVGEISGVPPVR